MLLFTKMSGATTAEITQLSKEWEGFNEARVFAAPMMPRVCKKLRHRALTARYLSRESSEHRLQPTALNVGYARQGNRGKRGE